MKEIIYGTTNPAKVSQMRDILEPLGVTVKGLSGFGEIPSVDETEKTAEENARLKAISYAKTIDKPVLSMDTGLYFNDLPDDQQPGLHVRRIDGVDRSSDEELIQHYTNLAQTMGNEIKAFWRYAYALAWPDGDCVSFTADAHRIFVNIPSKHITPGYPLESLQIDPASRKYIADMTDRERAEFWRSQNSEKLQQFIRENYLNKESQE